LLGYAYVLQLVDELEPCPLCIFQRLAFFGLGVVFLVAAIHHPGRGRSRVGSRIYAVLAGLASASGAAIAARHVWIQHLPPDQVPECGPGLDYMLNVFPLWDTVKEVLSGSGECAEVSWTFLGLTIPGWSFIAFVVLGIGGVLVNWRGR